MTIARAHIPGGRLRGAIQLREDDEALDRAARAMIANHGPNAAREAERRAKNLLPFGVGGQAATWYRISAAIRKIETAAAAAE